MFNAKQMLEQFMQAAGGDGAASATSNGTSQGGGLGSILNNPAVTGALSGAGGGLLAGLLMSNKKVRKVGGTVVAVGAAVGLGAIAISAYKNWQKNKAAQPQGSNGQTSQPASGTGLDFDSMSSPAGDQQHSRAILAAIIAGAKADGHFDERERQIINEQMARLGDPDAAEWVQHEIYKPLDVAEVARPATSPQMAAEIYLASLVITGDQNEREKAYLDALARQMGLEPQLRREIEIQLTNYSL